MQVPSTGRINAVGQQFKTEDASYATPDAFGAGVGRAMQQAGSAAAEFGAFVSNKVAEQQRFVALQGFDNLQTELGDVMQQAARAYDPAAGKPLVEQVSAEFDKRSKKYLATLSPNLQGEFSARLADLSVNIHTTSMKYQTEAMDAFAKTKLSDLYDQARLSLDQNGSAANLDVQWAKLSDLIATSGLSQADKTAIARQMQTGLAAVSYKSEVRTHRASVDALGIGSPAAASGYLLIQSLGGLPEEAAKAAAMTSERLVGRQVSPLIWASLDDNVKAGLISLIADKGELPPSVLKALKDGGDVAAAVEGLGGDRRKAEAEVMRGDALLPAAALDTDPRYQNIPYEDRLALRADAERELTQSYNAETEQQKARDAAVVNALMVGILDGSAGQADLDSLRQAGILTDYDAIKRAQDLLDKQTEAGILASGGFQKMTLGLTFDPSSEDDKKALNAMVGPQGLAALQSQNSDYVLNTLVPMVRNTKDIPTDVAGLLSGMIRSGDFRRQNWALDVLSQLQQASPDAYAQRTDDAVAKQVSMWQTLKDYYPPEQLSAALLGGVTQEDRVRTKEMQADAASFISSNQGRAFLGDPVAELTAGTGGWFQAAAGMSVYPGAVQQLSMDYNNLYIEFYSKIGNAEQAKQKALEFLKRDWAVTSVGGKKMLMKYPPELVGYPPINGSMDWVTEQGRQDLGLGPNETFQLFADDQTIKEAMEFKGGQGPGHGPSYRVIILGADGVMRSYDPTGAKRLYFDSAPYQQQQLDEWQKQRDELAARDKARENELAILHKQQTGLPWGLGLIDQNDPNAGAN